MVIPRAHIERILSSKPLKRRSCLGTIFGSNVPLRILDLGLTGFDVHELDTLRDPIDEEKANQAPPLPEIAASRIGDLWLCGDHRVLCGDETSAQDVARLLGERQPRLMVSGPPYGVSLDSEWRDRAGLNSPRAGRT